MKQKSVILRLILGTLTIMLAVAIFMLSNQPASQSSHLSMTFAAHSLPYIEKWTGYELSLAEWNRILRKLAHFSLFFFLAIFLITMCRLKKLSWRRSAIITLFIAMSYAVIDESHQLFIEGRGASIRDVAIDSAGAILGIVVVFLVGRRWLK
ncbi:hypothetical protein J40TS1_21500 [Paenibacillus montaniterrae]|uniref:VanZ-like domain-containing protein n=1 Tax=Paenibacillus montaniterrae TaxID=429341 RepID=A0A920CYL2_9BACL|nr:VanZ family protein [Paenibacillus montaniterrae]GIP16508.1 hypothetical protein J40TS1_21500 [Paenibacillus montaniterrae]